MLDFFGEVDEFWNSIPTVDRFEAYSGLERKTAAQVFEKFWNVDLQMLRGLIHPWPDNWQEQLLDLNAAAANFCRRKVSVFGIQLMNLSYQKNAFRSVVSRNLQLLSTWLKEPMVSRWDEDPDHINELEEHLVGSRIRMMSLLAPQ